MDARMLGVYLSIGRQRQVFTSARAHPQTQRKTRERFHLTTATLP